MKETREKDSNEQWRCYENEESFQLFLLSYQFFILAVLQRSSFNKIWRVSPMLESHWPLLLKLRTPRKKEKKKREREREREREMKEREKIAWKCSHARRVRERTRERNKQTNKLYNKWTKRKTYKWTNKQMNKLNKSFSVWKMGQFCAKVKESLRGRRLGNTHLLWHCKTFVEIWILYNWVQIYFQDNLLAKIWVLKAINFLKLVVKVKHNW